MQTQQKPRTIFGASVADAPRPEVTRTVQQRIAFLKRVYGWMFGGIVATAMGFAIAVEAGIAESLARAGFLPMILLFVGWVASGFIIRKVRHIQTWNVVAFAAYGLFTGIVFSGTIFVAILVAQMNALHPSTYILQAGGLTLVAFGGLTAYALFTKRDFSFLRGILMVSGFILIGMIVISFFVESSALSLIVTGFGVLFFAGHTLYDTQKILRTYPDGEHVEGAMTLFVDFVFLFLYILSFLLQIASGGD